MHTIAIVNQKGGVGKTTTAVTLAHGLAIAGAGVLLVDLDAQGNVADALGLEKCGGLYQLLFGNGTAARAVQSSGRPGLDVVLADKSVVEVKNRLAGMDFREYVLQDALKGFSHEVCVLDVAPGVDILQVSALMACDTFVVPVALDHLAVVGASDALASWAALQERSRGAAGRFVGVLPTMWERTTKESQEQLQAVVQLFGDQTLPPVPLDVKAREAPAHGESLWEYASGCRALRGVEIGGKRRGGYMQVLARVARELRG